MTVRLMQWWWHISIQVRLLASITLFAMLLLVCAGSIVFVGASSYFHQKTQRDLLMLSSVLATNSGAAVAFNDTKSAEKVLEALRDNNTIVMAATYQDDSLFAVYPQNASAPSKQQLRHRDGVWREGDFYLAAKPINVASNELGTLVLKSNLTEWQVMRRQLIYLITALGSSLGLLAAMLAFWLRNTITGPLAILSEWATTMSRDKNLNARAKKVRDDEIGRLVDSINAMVSELSQHALILSFNKRLQGEIEERRRVEKELISTRDKAEAANESKSRFLANMSHEIRTPMNAIIGFIEVLLRGNLANDQRNQLNIVRRSARQLHRLLNDILDVAKMEQEKLSLESIPFDLSDTLSDMMRTFEATVQEKGLAVELQLEPDLPKVVLGDPLRLNQILTNLVGNAIKFTDKGKVWITVDREPGKQLHFCVSDTGIGISAEKQHEIFQNFSQADVSISRRYGGSGLGTTIAKQLVELMGGRIWINSEPGKGSHFHFAIPLPASELHPMITYGETDGTTLVPDCRPLLILVAEDVEENAELLKVRLEALGHKLMHVDNGAKAVALFPQHAFDLILMDIQMPVMHGLAASQEIRKLPGGERVPILALTASVLPENRQACHSAGMNGFITKPLVFEELFAEMARVLNVPLVAQAHTPSQTDNTAPNSTGAINLQKALRNWQSQEVYTQALGQFLQSSESNIDKLYEALGKSDFDQLNAHVHALKGVVGNLALDNCYEHVMALSTGLKNRTGDYRLWIRSIDNALKATRDALPLLQNITANIEPKIESPQQLLQDLKQLDETFAKADADDQLLARVIAYLRQKGADEGGILRLKYASEEFEFERARMVLGDLTQSLHLSGS